MTTEKHTVAGVSATLEKGDTILGLAEASRLIAEKRLSSRELVERCYARIDAHEAAVGSFVTQMRETALTRADEADREIAAGRLRGALHGIPYTLKDIVETAGVLTAAQSRSLASHIPEKDAAVETRLREAGGVLLGKATTWEFAHGGPSWDVLRPPARNPWRVSRDPSGSSSGSAAGVAAGFSFGSIGSDTGGSIRGPASACGISGLKPTFGRVSRVGVIPNSFTHDHVGPLAWHVEDVAMLLQAIAGHDPSDPASARQPVQNYLQSLDAPLAGRTIGVPYDWFEAQVPASDVVRSAFGAALKVFESLGARIRRVVLPPIQAFEDAKKLIAAVELFTAHRDALRHTPELLGESFRVRVMGGGMVSGETYVNAHRLRRVLAAKVHAVMDDVDLLVLPSGEPAGLLQAKAPDAFFYAAGYLTAFCVTGQPALATRMGFAPDGMPLSIQIVGKPFDEATVLNAGHQYERATDWHRYRPRFLQEADA